MGTGEIVAGDFSGNGHLGLAVTDEITENVSIFLGNGDGTFQPAVAYPLGEIVHSLIAGDFNGDGKLDLAVTGSSGVSLMLGNGDGTFRLEDPGVGAGSSLLAGDFNDDGKLDLAYLSGLGVSVSLGNGNGTFQPPISSPVGLVGGASQLVAGDFNGDSKLDLADANNLGLYIMMGNGDGTFQPAVDDTAGIPVGDQEVAGLVTGDFNGDNKLDLAIANQFPGSVTIVLGNGDGSFQPGVTYAVSGNPGSLVAGDFTGNGRLDLATANFDGTTSLLLGNGDGTFQPPITAVAPSFTVGHTSVLTAIAAGDFNGDGRLDIAAAANRTDVSLLLGNGNGTFQLQSLTTNPVGGSPQDLVSGDFNGDGRLDLAVASVGAGTGEISILLGNGNGTFQPAMEYAVGSDPAALVAGDFNGDGRLDLAVADDSGLYILLGNGDGTFQPAVEYAAGIYPQDIVAGDFNDDGKLDLVVAESSPYPNSVPELSIFLGNGDGTFRRAVEDPTVTAIGPWMLAGDFTGDGNLDLAYLDDGVVSVMAGNGDGTFQPPPTATAGLQLDANSLVAGDFNGDGKLVLAAIDSFGDEVSVSLGNGDGTFPPQVTYVVGSNLGGVVAGAFTGDGRTDLAFTAINPQSGAAEVSVLLSNGDGTFQPAVESSDAGRLSSLVVGDFNSDGKLDFAGLNQGSDSVEILLGSSGGAFADASQLDASIHATPSVVDANGDGTDDVLVIGAGGDILYRQGIAGAPGSFLPPVTINPGFPSRDIAWVAETNQGPLLASVNAEGPAISLYAWRDGGFVRIGSLATGQLPTQISSADLNGDGLDDIVVQNAGDGTLSIFFAANLGGSASPGTQLQPFFPPAILSVGLGVSDVQAIDTTGDDRLDLVITNAVTGQVSVLRNLGGDSFAAPVTYRAGAGFYAIDDSSGSSVVTSLEATAGVAAASFTTGGLTDLVTISPGSNTLDVLAGLGGGRYANPVGIPTSNPAQVVRVADLNQDGIPDLAVLTTDAVSIYLGNGKGGFFPRSAMTPGPSRLA